MPALATAFVRIIPDTTGFKAAAAREVNAGMSGAVAGSGKGAAKEAGKVGSQVGKSASTSMTGAMKNIGALTGGNFVSSFAGRTKSLGSAIAPAFSGTVMPGMARSGERAASTFGQSLAANSRMGGAMNAFRAVGAYAAAGVAVAFGYAIYKGMQIPLAQLKTSLKNAGTSFEQLQGPIGGATSKMADLGFGMADTYQSIIVLTRSTGDARLAIASQGTVADLARAKHIGLADAATLVAKAAEGQIRGLRGLGVAVITGTTYAQTLRAAEVQLTDQISHSGGIAKWAAEHHIGLSKAQDLVSKASKGNIGALNQLGYAVLPKSASSAQKMAQITAALNGKLHDTAKAVSETAGGKITAMKTQFNNLAASVGLVLLPVFKDLVTGLSNIMKGLFALPTPVKIAIVAILALGAAIWAITAHPIIAAIALIILALLELAAHWRGVWTGIKAAWAWLKAHEWVAQLIPIIGTLVIISNHWKQISAVWKVVWRALQTAWNATVRALRVAWNAVAGFFRTAWEVPKKAWLAVWNALRSAWNTFTRVIRTIWNSTAGTPLRMAWNAIKTVWLGVWTVLRTAWNNYIKFLRAVWDAVSGVFRGAWNVIKGAWLAAWNELKSAWNTVVSVFSSAWDAIARTVRSVWDNITKWFDDYVVKPISSAIDGLVNKFKGVWDHIKSAWNSFIGFFGFGSGGAANKGKKKAAGGAIVGPGGPTSDSIVAWLSNGEYVVNAASVKKYGMPLMEAINAGKYLIPSQKNAATAKAAGGPILIKPVTAKPRALDVARAFTTGFSLFVNTYFGGFMAGGGAVSGAPATISATVAGGGSAALPVAASAGTDMLSKGVAALSNVVKAMGGTKAQTDRTTLSVRQLSSTVGGLLSPAVNTGTMRITAQSKASTDLRGRLAALTTGGINVTRSAEDALTKRSNANRDATGQNSKSQDTNRSKLIALTNQGINVTRRAAEALTGKTNTLTSAFGKHSAAATTANAKHLTLRHSIEATGNASQKSQGQTDKYTGSLGKIPPKKDTHITVEGVGKYKVTGMADGGVSGFARGGVAGLLDRAVAHFASGGAFAGTIPGWSPGIDNHIIAVSGGEGVLTPEATRGIGGAPMINAINYKYAGHRGAGNRTDYNRFSRGYARGGIPRYEAGGLVAQMTARYGPPGMYNFDNPNITNASFVGHGLQWNRRALGPLNVMSGITAQLWPGGVQTAGGYRRGPDSDITGPGMHQFGIALDINAANNIMGTGNNIPMNVVSAFKGHGWAWGGTDFGGYKDYMHFDLRGSKGGGEISTPTIEGSLGYKTVTVNGKKVQIADWSQAVSPEKLGQWIQGEYDKTVKAIQDAVAQGVMGGGGGPVSPGLRSAATWLLGHGLNKAAVAGIVGCIAGESGGDPESRGSGGGGLIGWTPESSARPIQPIITGNPARDMGVQLTDLIQYIKDNGSIGDMNSFRDPMAAAWHFSEHYERPAVTGSDIRAEVVRSIFGMARGGVVPGYANGTTGAAPGWKMVGEKGPELMYSRGGEIIVPAGPSAGMRGYATGTAGWFDDAVRLAKADHKGTLYNWIKNAKTAIADLRNVIAALQRQLKNKGISAHERAQLQSLIGQDTKQASTKAGMLKTYQRWQDIENQLVKWVDGHDKDDYAQIASLERLAKSKSITAKTRKRYEQMIKDLQANAKYWAWVEGKAKKWLGGAVKPKAATSPPANGGGDTGTGGSGSAQQIATPNWTAFWSWVANTQLGTVPAVDVLAETGWSSLSFAHGGVIAEPVSGIGLSSGRSYTFGEKGPETVLPGAAGAGGADLGAKLDRMITLLERAPVHTAAGLAEALNGITRSAPRMTGGW